MTAKRKSILARRQLGTFVSSIVSISLVLVLVGCGSFLLVNAQKVSDYFKESLKVSVLLKPDVTDAEGAVYAEELKEEPFVSDAVLVDKNQGLQELKEMLGEDFVEVFDAVPIPTSVDLFLQSEYVSVDSLEVVREKLSRTPIVDEVECEQALVEALSTNMSRIYLIIGVFIAIMLFISVILISNMVRMTLFNKRYSVSTMQLVGASRSFIRRPYMGKAMLQGALSSVVAIGILALGYYFVRKSVPQLFEIVEPSMLALVALIVFVSGLLICLVSTFFVMNRLLSMSKSELYG
ncbi:MAG: permease-like cell division protein FtsX [Bacteroidales bacterium]|nr:permease-like cell division protein FtsX [Bacteroidales bacterium]